MLSAMSRVWLNERAALDQRIGHVNPVDSNAVGATPEALRDVWNDGI
jgi:hypothetical protein